MIFQHVMQIFLIKLGTLRFYLKQGDLPRRRTIDQHPLNLVSSELITQPEPGFFWCPSACSTKLPTICHQHMRPILPAHSG